MIWYIASDNKIHWCYTGYIDKLLDIELLMSASTLSARRKISVFLGLNWWMTLQHFSLAIKMPANKVVREVNTCKLMNYWSHSSFHSIVCAKTRRVCHNKNTAKIILQKVRQWHSGKVPVILIWNCIWSDYNTGHYKSSWRLKKFSELIDNYIMEISSINAWNWRVESCVPQHKSQPCGTRECHNLKGSRSITPNVQ